MKSTNKLKLETMKIFQSLFAGVVFAQSNTEETTTYIPSSTDFPGSTTQYVKRFYIIIDIEIYSFEFSMHVWKDVYWKKIVTSWEVCKTD